MRHIKTFNENDTITSDDYYADLEPEYITRQDVIETIDMILDSLGSNFDREDIGVCLNMDADPCDFKTFNMISDEIDESKVESFRLSIGDLGLCGWNKSGEFPELMDKYINYLTILKSVSNRIDTLGLEFLSDYFFIEYDTDVLFMGISKITD